MSTILTIDTGTTNTRVSLWRKGQAISRHAMPVGVRNSAINGSHTMLQTAVRDTIATCLAQAGVAPEEVNLALASGMISSPLGLHQMPHLSAPAGLSDLALRLEAVTLHEVFSRPIWFIPGVRNRLPVDTQPGTTPKQNEAAGAVTISLENCEAMDMMRGEETEVFALQAGMRIRGAATLVMPGSHTKIIALDEEGRIAGCATTLAGELMQNITTNTILADSLQSQFASSINPKMVLAGAALAQKSGVGRACFSIRIMDQFADSSANDRANFLLGALLSEDVKAMKNSSAISLRGDTPVIVAGKGVARQALALLIKEDDFFSGTLAVVNDAQNSLLSGYGALRIARERGLLPRSDGNASAEDQLGDQQLHELFQGLQDSTSTWHVNASVGGARPLDAHPQHL
ncbi:2-dehydro-3-deoxygalactonokinase [soil metagenome]